MKRFFRGGSELPYKQGNTISNMPCFENKLLSSGSPPDNENRKIGFKWMSAFKCWISDRVRQLQAIIGLKSIGYNLLFISILVLGSIGVVVAQGVAGNAASEIQAESKITPLKIGDKIPDELWDMYFPVVSASSEQVQYLSLGDFKDKLIILGFWATWCGSCVSAFPKAHALAEEFKDDLLLMPVGSDTEVDIRKFMTSHPSGKYLSESILDRESLRRYFPYKFIPHFVWIHEGKVLGLTNSDELNPAYLNDISNGVEVAIRQKVDNLDFNRKDRFDKNWEKLFEKNIVAKTILTRYVEGIGASFNRNYYNDSSTYRLAILNLPLIQIYYSTIKKPKNFFINEAKDKTIFENIHNDPDWYRENSYCYEFIIPSKMETDQISKITINELNGKLNLQSRLEKRMLDCYVIVSNREWIVENINLNTEKYIKKESLDKLVLSFNNRQNLANHIVQSPPILINELKNEESFFSLPYNIIDIDGFNEFMKSQGIMAVPAKREIEVFILSDY